MHRVHRHFTDRCLNLFVPVARYRCAQAACGWEGLFAPSLTSTLTPAPTRSHSADSYLPRRVLDASRAAPGADRSPQRAR